MPNSLPDYESVVRALETVAREMQRSADVVRAGYHGPQAAEIVAGNETVAKTAADALALLRQAKEDFEKYATHRLPSPSFPLGCFTREFHAPSQTFNVKCDCGLSAARERLGLG